MTEKTSPQSPDRVPTGAQPHRFQITLRGQMDERWMAAFDPISVTRSAGATTIEVWVDQAGLRFVVNRLWDLNCDISGVVEVGESSVRHGGQ